MILKRLFIKRPSLQIHTKIVMAMTYTIFVLGLYVGLYYIIIIINAYDPIFKPKDEDILLSEADILKYIIKNLYNRLIKMFFWRP